MSNPVPSRASALYRALCVFILAVITPAAAMAEQAEIDEVMVTATRRPVISSSIPAGLTLLDGETVKAQKLVTDALASGVGVNLQQTTPGQGAAIIRGLKGSSILHLVDGLRLNNAIFRSAPTQYLALVPATAMERVEILRGTPASLYGSDAVGGVVQLVTRKPRFESSSTEIGGEVFLGLDTAELGKTLRATVDAGTARHSSSFSAEYSKTGDRRVGGGERVGPSAYTSKAARAFLLAEPDDRHSWMFDLHYLEQPQTPRVDELVPGFGQTEPSSSEFWFAPNRRLFAHGQYARNDGYGGLDWTVDLAWQRVDDDRVSRNLGSTERRIESNSSDLYGVTIAATHVFDRGSWVVGADIYHDRVRSHRVRKDDLTGGSTQVSSRFPDGSTLEQASIYANTQREVSERHMLSGGLRLSHQHVELPLTDQSNAASIRTTDMSGDVGWLFDATDSVQLVANMGFGFRAPNVFDLGTLGNRPGNRFNVPNTDLDSEYVIQADLGMRYRSERAYGEMMLYAMRYDDRIASEDTGAMTPSGRDIVRSVNASLSEIHGIEAAGELQISPHIALSALLNYTWAKQRLAGLAAEPGDRIPPLNGHVSLTYEVDSELRFEGTLRFADRQDRLSARDVRDVRIDPSGTAGWAAFDMAVYWNTADRWLIDLRLSNLFDKRYRMHGSGIDAVGRNVSLNVRHSWGDVP